MESLSCKDTVLAHVQFSISSVPMSSLKVCSQSFLLPGCSDIVDFLNATFLGEFLEGGREAGRGSGCGLRVSKGCPGASEGEEQRKCCRTQLGTVTHVPPHLKLAL